MRWLWWVIRASVAAAWPSSAAPSRRRVWRISDRNPLGEWVDPDARPTPLDRGAPNHTAAGWLTSSMDLLDGAEIVEEPATSPAVLYQEFISKHGARDDPKSS